MELGTVTAAAQRAASRAVAGRQLQGFLLHLLVTKGGSLLFPGEAAHGLFLRLVAREDAALAARLHEERLNSFFLGGLEGSSEVLSPGQGLGWRMAVLQEELRRFVPGWVEAGLEDLSLGDAQVRVLGAVSSLTELGQQADENLTLLGHPGDKNPRELGHQ
jgi:hypothetical protein